jgi:peptidoglycan/LPS O-acetylase OafA/YrhL
MASHFVAFSNLPKAGFVHKLLAMVGQGGLGVTTFFVISGFLITTLLLKEQDRTGGIHLGRFYFRRSMRIFPPFYVYLAVCVAVACLRHHPMPWPTLATAAAYVSDYYPYLYSHPESTGWLVGHTWSLSVEEQFYLIWPLTLVMVRGRSAIRWCVAILLVTPFLRLLTAYCMPLYAIDQQWYRLFHTTIDVLVCGCLLALLVREPWFKAKIGAAFHPVLLFGACGYLLIANFVSERTPMWYESLFGISLTTGCIALLLLYVVLRPDTPVARVLNWEPVRHIGVISYSLYLWQQMFLGVSWVPNTYRNVLAALACAELSYWLVERPSLNVRDRLQSKFTVLRG